MNDATKDAELTPAGLRLDGTLYPLEIVRAALRGQEAHRELMDAAAVAVAVADVQRAADARLRSVGGELVARLRAHLDQAEAEAWARITRIVRPESEGVVPRVPRREG
jgi:hypothetical protein